MLFPGFWVSGLGQCCGDDCRFIGGEERGEALDARCKVCSVRCMWTHSSIYIHVHGVCACVRVIYCWQMMMLETRNFIGRKLYLQASLSHNSKP
jgi:hypothetical protein